jgi:glutamate synthase domain-containing protein 1
MNFELAKRTKRHPLSKPQIEVLQKLAERGACATAKTTWGVYVCGTATAALERRRLVKATSQTWDGHETGEREYEITPEGREALAKATFKIKAES